MKLDFRARVALVVMLVTAFSAGSVHAESFTTLYDDANAKGEKGKAYLETAHTQYLLGNRPESCQALEQARVNFETSYRDVEAIRVMVEGGGDLDGRGGTEVMSWVIDQEKTAMALGGQMADFWRAHCQ